MKRNNGPSASALFEVKDLLGGEFNEEMLQLARQVVAAQKKAAKEPIEAWAKRMAEQLCEFDD